MFVNIDINRHFPSLPFHCARQVPQSSQDYQLGERGLALRRGQTRDPLHNPANRPFIVPQFRQNRNYIVSDCIAFQESLAIQRADIDLAVFEIQARASQFALHLHARLTDIIAASLLLCSSTWTRPPSTVSASRSSRRFCAFWNLGSSTFSHFATVVPVNSRMVSVGVECRSFFLKPTNLRCRFLGKLRGQVSSPAHVGAG
jgi:hypothetical protein